MSKILIVDDSSFARNSLSLLVQNGGHEVVGYASGGLQALEMFESLQPDLVALDYLMEDMNGEEVLREMLLLNADVKVIIISGSGDHTLKQRLLETGAKMFIEKPDVRGRILNVIDQVMQA